MNINNLCMGCMTELSDGISVCPRCGYKVGRLNSSRGLQPQTILNGKYLVGKVIGEGGFGITYIAYDLVLNNRVAIKEYFPSELVTRDTSLGSQTALTVLTGSKEDQYKKGIERFIREAENLAKFNGLEGIVSVKEFFYENNTAYMVMEYIDGVTLSKRLENNGGKLPYDVVLEMMKPVMESLGKIHESGIIHRDISPDNIMLTSDGRLKLIDFGASRIVGNDDAKSLTVILKHGYAPEEQYHPDGKQGPWTDVYALSATMYRMITGIVPQESTDRILNGDNVEKVKKLVPEVPQRVSDAIMHGLELNPSSRTRNIDEFVGKTEGTSRKLSWKMMIAIGVAIVAVFTVLFAILLLKPFAIKETITESVDTFTEAETKENDKNNILDKLKEEGATGNTEEVTVEVEKNTNVEKVFATAGEYVYIRENTYIFAGPSNEENIDNLLEYVLVGDSYKVIESDDEYVKVVYGNKEGYIERKYLVNQKDYDIWEHDYRLILEKAGIDHDEDWKVNIFSYDSVDIGRYVRSVNMGSDGKSNAVGGMFGDFDGDGTNELFVSLFVIDRYEIWFAKDGNAQIVEVMEVMDTPEFWGPELGKTYVTEVWSSIIQAGKTVLLETGVYQIGEYEESSFYHYIVSNGKPIPLGIMNFIDKWGWVARYDGSSLPTTFIKCYSNEGEELWFSQYFITFYPTMILNGEVGECASCEITENDFFNIPGAQSIYEKCIDIWKDDTLVDDIEDYFSWGVDTRSGEFVYKDWGETNEYYIALFYPWFYGFGGDVPFAPIITNVKATNFLYNEAGYFTINFRIDVDWEQTPEGNYISYFGQEFFDNLFGGYGAFSLFNRELNQDGTESYIDHFDSEEITQLTGYALVSYLDGELVLKYMNWGEQELSSGQAKVLFTSDFENFNGLR